VSDRKIMMETGFSFNVAAPHPRAVLASSASARLSLQIPSKATAALSRSRLLFSGASPAFSSETGKIRTFHADQPVRIYEIKGMAPPEPEGPPQPKGPPKMPPIIPTILDANAPPMDLMSRLMRERMILLGTSIDDNVANTIVSQLMMMAAQDPDKDIKLYINSPGGSVTAGMAIYDCMNYIKPDVQTICFGLAASMGAFLLSAGKKGKRYAMRHARIMIHQPLGGAQGQATDIDIQAKEIMYHKKRLSELMAAQAGRTLEDIYRDTERDNFMAPEEARDYGLIDHVLEGNPKKWTSGRLKKPVPT